MNEVKEFLAFVPSFHFTFFFVYLFLVCDCFFFVLFFCFCFCLDFSFFIQCWRRWKALQSKNKGKVRAGLRESAASQSE